MKLAILGVRTCQNAKAAICLPECNSCSPDMELIWGSRLVTVFPGSSGGVIVWQPPFHVPLLAPGSCSDSGQPPARPKFKSISKCFHLTS